MANSTRIVVHPGFHKTGTTSLQRYLNSNSKLIEDAFNFYTHMGDSGARARFYGHKSFPWRLWAFQRSFRQFLNTVPDDKPIFLSRETFSGVMLGFSDLYGRPIKSYQRTAIRLLTVTFKELRRKFGHEVGIELLFTTRDHEKWLKSLYGHLLGTYRVTQDFEDWSTKFDPNMTLEKEAIAIANRLSPAALHIRKLEDFKDRHCGIAAAAMDIMGITEQRQKQMPQSKRENIAKSPDIANQLLALNRSDLSDKQLLKEKAKLFAIN